MERLKERMLAAGVQPKDIFKFMVVREPVDRFLSGFVDKCIRWVLRNLSTR